MLKTYKCGASLPLWIMFAGLCIASQAHAHGVAVQDQGFLSSASGVHLGPFVYLGAKHMVTGYDHLLYLVGVIFFLGKVRDVATFVSLFALGHSITLLVGVLFGIQVNPYVIDALIGLSVCYKALENLGTLRLVNPKIAVFGFGLAHGFGLSSKLQDLALSQNGLIANMLAFNFGVEIGQMLALTVLFWALESLRKGQNFQSLSTTANLLLFTAGLVLFGMQIVGYFTT